MVAAIEDATGKGLGGPRHFIGFARTWHKRKQEVYIKGICIHVCCHRLILNLEKARTTCVFTNNKSKKMACVPDSVSILCQILDRSSVSTLALWQVLPAHQLQQVSNGELWANQRSLSPYLIFVAECHFQIVLFSSWRMIIMCQEWI